MFTLLFRVQKTPSTGMYKKKVPQMLIRIVPPKLMLWRLYIVNTNASFTKQNIENYSAKGMKQTELLE